MRRTLSRTSFFLAGSLVAAVACGDDTGTQPLPTSGGAAGAGAGVSGSAGSGGSTVGGAGGTGGVSGSGGLAGKGGTAGTAPTAGKGGGGAGGSAGTMNNTDAECGTNPENGDSCTGEGDCSEGFRCDCENGTVTGCLTFGNQGGMGGMAAGGVNCGQNPQNGDECPAVGVCTNGDGCQCQAGTLEVVGCMDGGAGDTGEGGGGPGAGGTAGNGGNAGSNAGTAGSGMSGAGGASGVNCPNTPEDGDPCTGGPGVCPGGSGCYCSGPAGTLACP